MYPKPFVWGSSKTSSSSGSSSRWGKTPKWMSSAEIERRREEERKREMEMNRPLEVESDAWYVQFMALPNYAENKFHGICRKFEEMWNNLEMKVTILTLLDAQMEKECGTTYLMVDGVLLFKEGDMHSREEVLGMLEENIDHYLRMREEHGVNEYIEDNFILQPTNWKSWMQIAPPLERIPSKSLMFMIRVDNQN